MATVTVATRTALRSPLLLRSWDSVKLTGCLSCPGRIRIASHPAPIPTPRLAGAKRSFHASSRLCSSARISYRIAASASGKGRRPLIPSRNAYNFDIEKVDAIGIQKGKSYFERKVSRPESGEDAFFASKIGNSPNAVAFGIADGVGGWSESGVDPADFSHGFCTHMAQAALDWKQPAETLRAVPLMEAGYDRALNDKLIPAGGSTASIGVGYEDGTVQLANLGDSGSVLFRLAAVQHYSVPQTHAFNAPYQLSCLPPLLRLQAQMFGGRQYEDLPEHANITDAKFQHGDVLVLATDGVFDNLNNNDILKVVTRQMIATGAWTKTADQALGVGANLDALTRPGGLADFMPGSKHRSSTANDSPADPEKGDSAVEPRNREHTLQALIALAVAGEAKVASLNQRRDGPFAKESRRHWPWDPWRGGKPDDICVLVVIPVEEGRGSS